MLTAATLLGGMSLAGVPSVRRYIPVSIHRSPTALARISPMGFLVVEVGVSYFEWLNTISKPFNEPFYTNTDINTNTTSDNYIIPPPPLFTHTKDIIPLPPKALSNPSRITKDLVFVGHAPTCRWAYSRDPIDSDDQPGLRRSARIASAVLAARETATRTTSAPNARPACGRAPFVMNGGRRGGASGGGGSGPGGAGARNGATSGRRGRRRGAAGAPAPSPPNPPSTQFDDDGSDPDDDPEEVGWVYFFFFAVLSTLVGIGSMPKVKPPTTHIDEFNGDLVVSKPVTHPFSRITRMDMTSFLLFFILCGPGSERRRANMAHFLNLQDYNINNFILQPENHSISIQHMDQSVSTTTPDTAEDIVKSVPAATENHDNNGYSFASDHAFYADSEPSGSNIEADLSLALTKTCEQAVEEESVVLDGAVTRWKGKGKAIAGMDGAVLDSASVTELEDAVNSEHVSTFSRLYVPVYKYRRTYPKTITVFAQADNPAQAFVHFHLPNHHSNNRVMAVDLSRRKIPFLAKRIATASDGDVVEGEGDG
ncbi:hypothetical protein JR316_0005208 [Psilocybe cubensis]|nr:hypothetical protein JR316_0005208 [Psilocybe cubensis]KAH9483107.1 hypothetical protein JR316_0005208 [Psilocybe cubensis]